MNIEDITKPLGGQCPKCLQQKVNCICPKHNFKVGDYVRYHRSYSAEQRPHRITHIDGNKIHLGDAQTWSVSLQKWIPKQGEWCWYGFELVQVLDVQQDHIKICRQKSNAYEEVDPKYITPFTGKLPDIVHEEITYEKDSN
jgi:hypothetical protein